MASAKQGYPIVSRMLARVGAASTASRRASSSPTLDGELARDASSASSRLTPTIVEVVVRAPAAARALSARPVLPAAELRGARAAGARHAARDGRPRAHRRVGRSRRAVSCRRSCSRWAGRPICARSSQPGEPVVLMGPTGTPTEIEPGETVLLVGGGLGNAVLFSIGAGVSRRGLEGASTSPATSKMIDRYKVAEIEARRRRRRLVLRRGARLRARPRRRTARSSATSCEAMRAYAAGEPGRAADRARRSATASSRSAPTR